MSLIINIVDYLFLVCSRLTMKTLFPFRLRHRLSCGPCSQLKQLQPRDQRYQVVQKLYASSILHEKQAGGSKYNHLIAIVFVVVFLHSYQMRFRKLHLDHHPFLTPNHYLVEPLHLKQPQNLKYYFVLIQNFVSFFQVHS